jgi:peptide/nickel transport system permease protein
MKSILFLFENKKFSIGAGIIVFFIFIAIFASYIAPYSPGYTGFPSYAPISWKHPFGTTSLGQDIFSQVIWGTRLSLIIGIVCGFLSTLISVVIGFISGYYGGRVDAVLMFITNIFLVIPGLVLLIVLAAYIPVKGVLTVILIISVTSWAGYARVLRSQVMTLKNRDFIDASVVVGESKMHVIFFELFPNMTSLIVIHFFNAVTGAILTEAALDFLGLGDLKGTSWGTILYWGNLSNAFAYGAWAWETMPALLIALLGTSFILMNFAVDEITNPRLRKR